MTNKEAIELLKIDLEDYEKEFKASGIYKDDVQCLKLAIAALELVDDFERARIITGGRLNGRTHAYKCGLADGQRLAKGEKLFNILPLEETESEDTK